MFNKFQLFALSVIFPRRVAVCVFNEEPKEGHSIVVGKMIAVWRQAKLEDFGEIKVVKDNELRSDIKKED